MEDYNIFRENLAIRFPSYGHALWDPSPGEPGRPVEIGDVGFIRDGKFHRLFNALNPEDEEVPEGYEPLVSKSHLSRSSLHHGPYHSNGIQVVDDLPNFSSGPDSPTQVSFKYSGNRGGAVLSLPVKARRENALEMDAFSEWMVKHADGCFALAQARKLGIKQMKEIILVTGCDRTRSWTNIAFLGGEVNAEASFGVKVFPGPDTSIDIRFSPGHIMGAVLNHGPEGKDLPEDQCIFIRGFRVTRTLWKFPKRLKAAAGPPPDWYDHEPDTELITIPTTTEYGHSDPLHVLLDFVVERAHDCDMVIIHDNDLERIDRIGKGTLSESLQPEMMIDLIRMSNIEIYTACCDDLSPSSSSPNTGTGGVRIAMLSELSENWGTVPISGLLRSAAQNPGPHRAGELLATSRASLTLRDSLSVLPILGSMSKRKGLMREDFYTRPPSVSQDFCGSTLSIPMSVSSQVTSVSTSSSTPHNSIFSLPMSMSSQATSIHTSSLTSCHSVLPFPMPIGSLVPSVSTSNFTRIFQGACDEYQRLTGHNLYTHPFSAEIQSCNSADSIFVVLRKQAQTLIKRRKGHEKLLKYLNPIVNILFTCSEVLGDVRLPYSPGNTIFAGIGILLGSSQVMREVNASYDKLVFLFERVHFFLDRLNCYKNVKLTTAMTELLGKIMAQVLFILALSTKEMKAKRITQFTKWLLGRTDVEDALVRLDILTNEKNLKAVVPHIDENINTITETTQAVRDTMNNRETETRAANLITQATYIRVERQLRSELRKWLNPPNPSTNHNAACATQHAGTATWFTKGAAFDKWKNDNTLLWIRGNPGSGKSILCSAIVEDIRSMRGTTSALIAYYYFDAKDVAKRDLRGLLSSILIQLSTDSDKCLHVLSQLHMTCRDGSEQPSEESLAQCLKIMLGQSEQLQLPIYLIVDALDECSNSTGTPSARKKVLDFMTDLIRSKHPNLHLCITSRPEQDIQATLDPLTPTSPRVSLHEEGGQREDINNYIRYFVQTNNIMRKWRTEDRELVIDTLSERADGMFRWTYCQLDTLSRCFPPSIRKALNELPASLDETYEKTLQGIAKEKREHVHNLFQCLVAAIRPLRVDELAEIFAVDFDPNSEPKIEEGWRPENPEEAVLSACSSLIAIVGDKDTTVVQFSHFSVKEFLTSERFQTSELGKTLYISLDGAHTFLARACLTVLLQLDEKLDKQRLKTFPLASYAARHWVDHAKIENVASQSQDLMQRLFSPKNPHLVTWTRIYNIDKGNEPSTDDLNDNEGHPSPARATSLYYAALCGFTGVAEYLIVTHHENVNVECGHHGTPLHAASYEGHVDVARLLVEHGADVTMTNNHKRTALCSAYDGGRLEVMQMLLQHGANVEEPYAYSAGLLHIASHQGQAEVVELLLRNNANVNARDSVNETPLHEASRNGHLKVVELLLDKGADVHAETNSHSTPLHGASESGQLEVVRKLLEWGADVHLRNRRNRSPFDVATSSGHTEVAELLAEHA